MRKSTVRSNGSKLIVAAARKVASLNANTACTLITYQPKQPEAVKNLRKF